MNTTCWSQSSSCFRTSFWTWWSAQWRFIFLWARILWIIAFASLCISFKYRCAISIHSLKCFRIERIVTACSKFRIKILFLKLMLDVNINTRSSWSWSIWPFIRFDWYLRFLYHMLRPLSWNTVSDGVFMLFRLLLMYFQNGVFVITCWVCYIWKWSTGNRWTK